MSTLTHEGSRFVFRGDFDQRHVPKQAGFRWDPTAKVWWTDSPEKARALANIADAAARAKLEGAVAAARASIAASRATDADIDAPVPDGLAYLPYQRAGIAYAAARADVLIGDEMGLGKTIQAIGAINADASIKTALVICPASLKLNWQRELTKWLVRPLRIAVINGKGFPGAEHADICIVNYDVLPKHADAIRARAWDALIADECHYMKNPKARRTQQVLGRKERRAKNGEVTPEIEPVRARRRLFLTGTPIQNKPIEAWSLCQSLDPQGLGRSWIDYVRRYCAGHQDRVRTKGGGSKMVWIVDGASNGLELQTRLRESFMIRRLKKDVLKDLPPKVRQIIALPDDSRGAVDAENEAWSLVQDRILDAQAEAELAKAGDDEEAYETAAARLRELVTAAFQELSRLRHDTAVAKVPAVIEFVRGALEDDDTRKLVVLCWHHDVIDGIIEALNAEPEGSKRTKNRAVDRGGASGKSRQNHDVDLPMPMRDGEGDISQHAIAGEIVGMREMQAASVETRPCTNASIPAHDERENASEEVRSQVRSDGGRHSGAAEMPASWDPYSVQQQEIQSVESITGSNRSEQGLHPRQRVGNQLARERNQARRESERIGDDCAQIENETTIAVKLDGRDSIEARQAAVDRFQADPNCRVFVGSIMAAGVGITLTASSHVIFAELDWVPGNVSQAEDRCHRIGQRDSVLVQHLVLDGSLDARMAHTLVEKQAIIDRALDDPSATIPDFPVLPTSSASADVPRGQLEAEAAAMAPERVDAIHACLRILASYDPDGARDKNDIGFNGADSRIGHSLARQGALTPKQAALGLRFCRKYHRQLPADLLATAKGGA